MTQFVDHIRSVPWRWWSGIPGFGEGKGRGIRRFIEAHLGPIAASPAPGLPGPNLSTPGGVIATAVDTSGMEQNRARRWYCALSFRPVCASRMLAAARRDHLEWIAPSPRGDGGRVLHVVGKRGKHCEVPLPEELVQALQAYLAARGMPAALEDVPPGTCLIGKVGDLHLKLRSAGCMELVDAHGGIEIIATLPDGTPAPRDDGVRPQTIHETCSGCSSAWPGVWKAKTGWLRHTSAGSAGGRRRALDAVGALLGHTSLITSSQYVHAESQRMAEEMRTLWKRPA
jgi:hypothetical protein